MRTIAGFVARLLLGVARRRWPLSIRDGRVDEWRAEIHVLAAERRWWRMLGFAASLAVTRPALKPRHALTMDRRAVLTGTMLLLGPVAGLVLAYVGMFLMGLGLFGLLAFGLLLWCGGLLCAYAGANGAMMRRWAALPAVLLPCLAVVLYLPEFGVAGYRTLTRPTLLWAGLMVLLLIVVGLLPRPVSWWIGYAAAVAAAWVAVTWAVWLYAGVVRLDTSYAWLWFPASLLEIDIGPGPSGVDGSVLPGWFVVWDFTEIYPTTLLALGVYAVAYLIGVREHRGNVPEAVVSARS
jgi:hypothetical protein